MDLHKTLARRLKQLMLDNKPLSTHQGLERASGVSRSSIQRILQCKQNVTLHLIEKLAPTFGIRPSCFLLESAEIELLNLFKDLLAEEKSKFLRQLADSVLEAKNSGSNVE